MPVIIKKLNETKIQIKNYDKDLLSNIRDHFSFFSDNYRFTPKYKSGMWDGRIHLFDLRNDTLPIGFAKQLYTIVRRHTTDIVCDLTLFEKGYDVSEQEILDFCDLIKFEHKKPYPHQIDATIKCLKEKRLTVESATNSGKSFVLFLISNFLLMKNNKEKILIIVPTIQLVEQMTKDFCDYAKNWVDYNKYVHKIYSGQDKISNKQITISTYQSLLTVSKEYLKQFTAVLTDECHIIFNNTESTKAVNQIINNCTNAKYRYGFSGSLLNSEAHEKQLTGMFGPVERIINAKETIELGISSKFEIKCIILDHKMDRRIELKNKIDDIKNVKNVELKKYQAEIKFMREVDEKSDFLINFCSKIKKNTIVLFKTIEYGKKIYKELSLNTKKKIYYIDGTIKVTKREEIRANLERYDDCILVGSLGTVSTGINIKNVYNAVLAESMKSEIKLVQTIGRILRKVEGKSAVLYDVVDDLSMRSWDNYGIRHYRSRLGVYKGQEHEVKIMKIKV